MSGLSFTSRVEVWSFPSRSFTYKRHDSEGCIFFCLKTMLNLSNEGSNILGVTSDFEKKPLITVQTREKQNKWRNVAAQYARRWETLEADLASDGAGSYKRHAVLSSLSGAARYNQPSEGIIHTSSFKTLTTSRVFSLPYVCLLLYSERFRNLVIKFILQGKLRNSYTSRFAPRIRQNRSTSIIGEIRNLCRDF
jgi:hypothetical protein